MNATELKNVLIHQIAEIDDVSFLEAIKTIVDSKMNQEVLTLTQEQKDEIMASKKEIEEGNFIEQDALDKEIKEWLKEK
ncbi:MAG: hypothetical protein K9I74_06670 [Bacteroidales bacterium]|nr:hypothetical protein [Bacteroidales bacterium]